MAKKRGKDDWDKMSASELTNLLARRYSRIEVLRQEIKELQLRIDKKTKERVR